MPADKHIPTLPSGALQGSKHTTCWGQTTEGGTLWILIFQVPSWRLCWSRARNGWQQAPVPRPRAQLLIKPLHFLRRAVAWPRAPPAPRMGGDCSSRPSAQLVSAGCFDSLSPSHRNLFTELKCKDSGSAAAVFTGRSTRLALRSCESFSFGFSKQESESPGSC